jgi:hypothetical protein
MSNNEWTVVTSGRPKIKKGQRTMPFHTRLAMSPYYNNKLRDEISITAPEICPIEYNANVHIMSTRQLQLKNIFILSITENGNGYSNESDQKIITFGYDQETIENIYNILLVLNRRNTYNRKVLNINILDYDMTLLNFDYVHVYSVVTDYTQTHIFSIEIGTEHELSDLLIVLFDLMTRDTNVAQVLFTRRKKYIDNNKSFFFLVKIFITKSYTIDYIKTNVLTPSIIGNFKLKLKINDIEIDKSNKLEKGIRKNNWINVN